MKNMKDLLIVEMSSNTLDVKDTSSKDYVLEGIFGEIDVKNKNQRIYTEDEYVPQIEALQQKIKAGKLLGELDHPSQFDVSLKNVSHIIEELTYDKDSKQVRGRIRLLDTDAGRQAKALVDAGVPLQISSRAAGAVESNGKVKIKQLFTYDLVADPGFENAELKRVNESFGFTDNAGLFIYEIDNTENSITNQSEIKENQNMAEFVKADDFNKYTEYLANEIKGVKEAIEAAKASEDKGVEESLAQKVEDLTAHNDHIVESVNKLSEYAEYLATKLDESIQYTEHVAEKTDQSIQYTEHVAEKADKGIQYSEHLAESLANLKEYANYLAEAHNENTTSAEKLVGYVNYLKENLQSVSEYAEYIAESINENLVVEEVEGKEPEEAHKEDELENIGDNGEEGKVSADGEKAGEHVKDFDSFTKEVHSEEDKKTTDTSDEQEADLEDGGEEGKKEVVETATDIYKKEISEKLNKLVESATAKENANPSFFKIVSSSTQEKYNTLNEEAKSEVKATVAKRGFMTEAQIVSLIESSNLIVENRNAEPFFISAMPVEYKEAWENLSESKRSQIEAQAKYHKLSTEYQVRNFWQTRDLRDTKVELEKVAMVSESKTAENTGLGYDVTAYAEQLKKRFKK